MRCLPMLLLCGSSTLFAGVVSTEIDFARKVHSSFIIKDCLGAKECVEAGLHVFPDSSYLQALHIQALSEEGKRKEALTLFKEFSKGKDLKELFSPLESLSWSYLLWDEEKSERTRLTHLIAASLTKDARAVATLHRALLSANTLLRGFAVRFCASYNDRSLQKEVIRLSREEKDWFVRGEIVQALGAMRLVEGIPFLKDIVASKSANQEEKASAIQSLLQIQEKITEKDLDLLLTHKRGGLRRLGVAFVDHFGALEYVPKVLPLLHDSSPDVRMGVLAFLGTMPLAVSHRRELEKELPKLLEDVHPGVVILSAWLSLGFDEEMGKSVLKKYILSNDQEEACFAATALGAGGKHMTPFIYSLFKEVRDSFVKVNLSLALLKNGGGYNDVAPFLASFITEEKGQLMWTQNSYPMFTSLVPSKVRHMPHVPSYPKEVDQLTRLRLLNILCIAGYDKAGELVRSFLHNRIWGVIGTASMLVLEEGDLEAADLIRALLSDPEEEMRVQAALALAFHGGDQEVRLVLEEAYPKMSWDKKITILEALGFIGNRDSIPFLLAVMEEPFQLSRTIAASSIIQCLYH